MDVIASTFCVARALEHQGKNDEALADYRTAITRGQRRYGMEGPNVREMREDWLLLLRRLDDRQGLLELYTDYLAGLETATQSGGAAYQLLGKYAELLLTCEVESMRDPVKALAVAKRAVESGGHDDPKVIHTLVSALHENGPTEQAVAEVRRAIGRLSPEQNDDLR